MTFHHTTRRLSVFSASVILLAILCPFFKASAQETTQTDARQLNPGETLERELGAAQEHIYKVTLTAGQYLHVTVEQLGINATITILDPNNVEIGARDWWWREGKESVWVATQTTGTHLLTIGAPSQPPETGKYRIKLETIRNLQDASTPIQNSVAAHRAFTEGESLLRSGTAESQSKAIEKYQQALGLWRAINDNEAVAHALNGLGVIAFRSGNLKQAVEYLDEAVALFGTAGNRRGAVNSFTTLSNVHNFAGDTQKALDAYNRALPLARAIKDYRNEAGIMAGLGSMLHRVGQTEKALATLNELVSITKANGYLDGEAVAHNNIGLIYVSQGRLREAVDQYNQTLSLLEVTGDRFGQSFALNNIGNAHARMGEFQQALDYLLRSLSLKRLVGDKRGEAASLGSIGNLYLKMGDEQKSLKYYDQSLALSRTIGARDFETAALSNLGVITVRLNNLEKALEYSTQALAMRKQSGDRNGEAYDLTNLGLIYARLGDTRKALENNQKALDIRRSVADRYGEAQTLSALGSIYEQLGDAQKALDSLNQAVALAKGTGDKLGEASALFELARLERRRGGLREASARLKETLKIVESIRTKVSLADVRNTYFASRQDYYDLYIGVLMQLYKSENNSDYLAEAFLANERRSARSLLDSLVETRANIRSFVAPELLADEQRLQRDLNAKADQQLRLLSRKHTTEQSAALSRELETLSIEYEQTLAQIRQASPRYAALTQPSPASLKQIQEEVLDPDSLLLEYTLGEERSYLWAITDKSITSYELPKRSEIETDTRRVHDLIVSKADAVRPEVLRRLSQVLLGPVAGQLGRKRLVIVAQGPLQYLSFGALPMPSSPERGTRPHRQGARRPAGEPLLANHEIVSLPSSSVMAELRRDLSKRKRAARKVIVLADPVFAQDDPRIKDGVKTSSSEQSDKNATGDKSDSDVVRSASDVNLVSFDRLPLSRREAELITAGIPKGQFQQALDFSASRAAATNPDVGEFQIVHFATHSLINNRHPELSGIVLSLVDEQGKPQDGFLRLHEIYNLKLGADLVVLSACQTAVGKDIRGEGLIGLTRGFMYAGAPRVVATLWKVSDSATAELMSRFYQNMLRKGSSPSASLRAAQLSMRREKQWAAPYYWAGFVLQGEWR